MPILVKLALILAIFTAGFGGGVAVSRNHFRPVIAEMKQKAAEEARAAAEAVTKAVQGNTKVITELERQHEADKRAVADLFVSLGGVHVSLPSSICSGITAAPGSVHPTAPGGRTDSSPQIAFDEATAGMASDAKEWSDAIDNCRVLQRWAQQTVTGAH